MDPVTPFRGQLEHGQRFRDLQREAEQQTLAGLANEDSPRWWQRIIARLPQVEITAPSIHITLKNPAEAIAKAIPKA